MCLHLVQFRKHQSALVKSQFGETEVVRVGNFTIAVVVHEFSGEHRTHFKAVQVLRQCTAICAVLFLRKALAFKHRLEQTCVSLDILHQVRHSRVHSGRVHGFRLRGYKKTRSAAMVVDFLATYRLTLHFVYEERAGFALLARGMR